MYKRCSEALEYPFQNRISGGQIFRRRKKKSPSQQNKVWPAMKLHSRMFFRNVVHIILISQCDRGGKKSMSTIEFQMHPISLVDLVCDYSPPGQSYPDSTRVLNLVNIQYVITTKFSTRGFTWALGLGQAFLNRRQYRRFSPKSRY